MEQDPKPSRFDAGAHWTIGQVTARDAEITGKPMAVNCPVCKGLGMVKDPALVTQKYLYGQFVRCPTCSEPERRLWLAEHCGVERSAQNARLSDWRPGDWDHLPEAEREERIQQRRRAYSAMRKAIEARAGLYTFYGGFGSGKTFALTIVCNELREDLVEAFYAPLASILDHLRSLYGQGRDTSEYWQRLLDVPVLALDEVGRFNATPWSQEKLFVLADTRYRRRSSHLTLFATNDNPHDRETGQHKYGVSSDSLGYLTSRMREGCIVELRGDMRPALGALR